eukprot:Nitzschia sp. Nitz4//scaffold38_size140716//138413//139702//NITZ4_003181-RA/size140716-processed-gene-0.84-mRNA-1//-1//CDS//3329550180//3539//frame0
MAKSATSLVAHIHCPLGLSEPSLYAAFLDATPSLLGLQMSDVLSDFGLFVEQNLHEFDWANAPWETKLSRKTPTSPLELTFPSTHTRASWNIDQILYVFAKRIHSKQPSDFDWIFQTIHDILMEVKRAGAKVSEQAPVGIKLDTFYCALGILYCLHLTKVQQVSVSTIRTSVPAGSSFAEGVVRELFVGLTVVPQENAGLEPLRPVAVSLLKVLSQAGTPNASMIQPLSVESFGRAVWSTNNVVTVTFGRPPQADVPSAPPAEETNSTDSNLWESDSVTLLECNVDDMTGELLANSIDLLLECGALDAWLTPIIMKKGRPAHTLHCLSHPENKDKLLEAIFRHTTTLGVRVSESVPRAKLTRDLMVAQTKYINTSRKGQVDVKASRFKNGELVSLKAEFDHCKIISQETGIPLKTIADEAVVNVQAKLK